MPIFLLLVFVALALILLLLISSWRQTPHGRLDTMPAVLLRLAPQRPEDAPVEQQRAGLRKLLNLADTNTTSYRQFSKGYFLTRQRMRGFIEDYVPEEQMRTRPYISPLHSSRLTGLPPAVIFTAGFDPLHDEGAAYVNRLEEAGVPVHYHCYKGMTHGFFGLSLFGPKSTKAIHEISRIMRREDR